MRQMFAGMSPGHGLLLQNNSVCLPRPGGRSRSRGSERFILDLNEGQELVGSFLPSRQRVEQVLFTDATARQRLVVARKGPSLEIQNALGADIAELILRDAEGRLHRLKASLEAGGSAALEKVTEEDSKMTAALQRPLVESLPLGLVRGFDVLPAGCYLARLNDCPWWDSAGIDTERMGRDQAMTTVLGVLPIDGDEWR